MRFEMNCAECGGNRFSLEAHMEDSSIVICSDCGREIGTMGDLKQMVAAEVLKRSSARDLNPGGPNR